MLTQNLSYICADSGPDQELDWATIGYMDSDEFDHTRRFTGTPWLSMA